MNIHVPDNAVAVGLDGSKEGWQALLWAAARATDTSRPLHILHAEGALSSRYELSTESPIAIDNICDEGLGMVKQHHPDLAVTWSQPSESPTSALVRASITASEVVLGTRGTGAAHDAVLGSVTTQVSAAAHCPVIVVRGALRDGQRKGPVVVGVDARSDSDTALDFAFADADRRGVPLVAVLCWQLDRWDFASGIPMPGGDMKSAHQYHRDALEQALSGPASRHPGVQVTADVICGPSAGSLAHRSDGASLLVVGTRGHRELAGLVLSSVSQSVARHALCPVAVVAHAAVGQSDVVHDKSSTTA